MHCIATSGHRHYNLFLKILRVKKWATGSSSSFSSAGETNASKETDVSIQTLSPKYDFNEVEKIWYNWWESQNYFKATKSESESFVVLLPPPNVTGTLHLGHVLTATIQDVILRWKRMKGESVIWIPGIDHAGIATQVAVERHLRQTLGVTRHDLEKEDFINRIWEWKNEKKIKICQQLRTVGASLDWTRMKFTMDPVHSNLVTKSFIKLYNQGLIYRNKSLVNWSCTLRSSISDIEIDWKSIKKKTHLSLPGYEKPVEFGKMYRIAYKVYDGDDEIIVHTTRPETFLGDVAVAVHPNDERYSKYVGKMVWHPFRSEKIPVIADDFVDPNLGSGAVKITPSHNQDDFKIAQRHGLTGVKTINEDGLITDVGQNGKFFGMKRFEARDAIIDELAKLNLFRGVDEHPMSLPLCSRSGDVIEHILKSQWFLKCEPLAADAVDLVQTGRLKLIPDNYENVWLNWLKDCSDWNLSRQLSWGHQIPMYRCSTTDREIWVPGMTLEDAEIKACELLKVEREKVSTCQDPDVLDTWFSSGLLPLSALSEGTDKSPISLMVTGHDILFFWVARMVFLSRCLTGKLPFTEVLLHGLICDSKGRKMSKSLGNVIRPEDIANGRSLDEMKEDLKKGFEAGSITHREFQVALDGQRKMFPQGIPACGMDALRFSLCTPNFQSGFVNFDIKICQASRDFCNKMWQATKYLMKMIQDCKTVTGKDPLTDFHYEDLEKEQLNVLDRWIFSRLASVVDLVDSSIGQYRFWMATAPTRTFVTEEFCGVYLECSKLFVKNDPSQYRKIISIFLRCIETYLKLLSPFMPFVTEHLYQTLPRLKGFTWAESITTTAFPVGENWRRHKDEELEGNFREILKVLSSIREALVTYRMIGTKPTVHLKCSETLENIILGEANLALATLARADKFLPDRNHDGINVIERVISDDVVTYIEHKYDKATLIVLLGPMIEKEAGVRSSIDRMKKSEADKRTPAERLRFDREMTSMQGTLAKIEEFKKTIQNCTR